MMDRKKFFALFSTGIVGLAALKGNPLKLFTGNKKENKEIKVKLNPDAVQRDKPGKKNG
jgi:hypothetical protein